MKKLTLILALLIGLSMGVSTNKAEAQNIEIAYQQLAALVKALSDDAIAEIASEEQISYKAAEIKYANTERHYCKQLQLAGVVVKFKFNTDFWPADFYNDGVVDFNDWLLVSQSYNNLGCPEFNIKGTFFDK